MIEIKLNDILVFVKSVTKKDKSQSVPMNRPEYA